MAILALVASACGSRLTGNQATLAQGARALGQLQLGHRDRHRRQALGTGSSTPCRVEHDILELVHHDLDDRSEGEVRLQVLDLEHHHHDDGPLLVDRARPRQRLAGERVPGSHPGATATGAGATAAPAALAGVSSGAGACGANGNQAPAGGNGGATATGVTATTITVGNIASISGVAPGLTQSVQQATEAWAAYVNSTGGICGRQIKVQPFDDGNDSGTNYADASQACTADFAMVGSASGFDDGSAQAVGSCGIPDMASEVSTAAAGGTADIFGASPGNEHYWSLGPANYLKSLYPNAIQHAAMIYLQVPATQTQAATRSRPTPATASSTRRPPASPRRRPTPTTAPSCRSCRATAAST